MLKDCTTRVEKGEVVVVCGPSGSGKSTLIKCVNALEPFKQGEVIVNGPSVGAKTTQLPQLRAKIGMVFQHFELFPHMNVTENLNLAQIKVLGRSLDEATANIDSHTEAVIQQALAMLRGTTTIITIAHRLSTIIESDQIIVLHHGRIMQQGTHSQLLACDGLYRHMHELQLQKRAVERA